MRPAIVLLFVLVLAPSAHAAGWSTPRVFDAGGGVDAEPAPRAAVSPTGDSVVAYRTSSGRLVAVLGNGERFGRPRTVARRPFDFAAATGTRGTAIAWEAADGLHVSVLSKGRFRDVFVTPSTGSEINGVAIAADPLGGFVVAERQFPRRGSGVPYRVRAFSLDSGGRLVGGVADLGLGQFGLDARETQALVVLPNGRALLAFTRETERTAPGPTPVVLAARAHGGGFEPPVPVPSGEQLHEPRLTVTGDHAVLTATQIAGCGDTGCSGEPRAAIVDGDGVVGPFAGPALAHPRRAFAPWAAGNAIVFALKTGVQPFSREAPVRASVNGGPLQTLTSERAHEPIALSLESGKVLALWATRKAFGAALAARDGRFKRIRAPSGPPPSPFHTNATNRDIRAAGDNVIAAWSRGGKVRVSLRAF